MLIKIIINIQAIIKSIMKFRQEKHWMFRGLILQGYIWRGVSDKGDKFLFNPDISYLTTVQIENKKFWEIIKSSIQYAVTPVIVLDDLEAGPSVFKRRNIWNRRAGACEKNCSELA